MTNLEYIKNKGIYDFYMSEANKYPMGDSRRVELMRKARLSKAYRLLLSGDKNISEVAYEVGFSAPSYFTKCFKDEFGVLPGDVRSRM